MPDDKTMIDYTNKMKSYLRSAEVVEGKNHAYSQENNAVIATIENGKSYKVRWTGSATVTLKKNSASGTEVTSGSTSPLSFTADSDFDLYFGSSADVTEIMVYDGNDTSDTYEPYYVPVKDSKLSIKDQQVLGAWNFAKNTGASSSSIYGVDFTKNVDDTITANGTNDGTNSSTYIINANRPLKAGTYYLSGGVSANAGIQVYKSSSPYTNYGKSEGSEVTVTIPEDTNVTIIAYVAKNATISNVVLKPMISLEPNQPYVPYTMTNRELTDAVTTKNISSQVSVASGLTAYEVRTVVPVTVYKYGKIVMVRASFLSKTENAYPSGRTFITVLQGLPTAIADYTQTFICNESGKNPVEVALYGTELKLRGGSTDAIYTISFFYMAL